MSKRGRASDYNVGDQVTTKSGITWVVTQKKDGSKHFKKVVYGPAKPPKRRPGKHGSVARHLLEPSGRPEGLVYSRGALAELDRIEREHDATRAKVDVLRARLESLAVGKRRVTREMVDAVDYDDPSGDSYMDYKQRVYHPKPNKVVTDRQNNAVSKAGLYRKYRTALRKGRDDIAHDIEQQILAQYGTIIRPGEY